MADSVYPDLAPNDFVTPRQRQILLYLVRGMTREAIASNLYLSRSTVNRDIRDMSAILGAPSPEALGALAYREGFLSEGHLDFLKSSTHRDAGENMREPADRMAIRPRNR
ncbi:LuxR C-terminal-related transcriptional regulator [Glycomyces salinus]|uniref:LuxR C-terminal-related transcriptional regulator n=1 Tax=Glycomyces salinus TaxID=980294 RepID=UPI0018EA3DBE|nr:LuxR C-terminal-related transcriptional regulator [Glycomyces salinus]